MYVRSVANATWMHRNSTRLVHRLSSNRNYVSTTSNTLSSNEFRLGLKSPQSRLWLWKSLSTKRTTKIYNPYDALRREEQILHEQDKKQRSSTSQFTSEPSERAIDKPQSDRNATSFSFEYAVNVSANDTRPLMSAETAQEEYDNFEPTSKSKRQPDSIDELLYGKEALTSFAAWKTLKNETSVDVTELINSSADDKSLERLGAEYRYRKELELAFFNRKDELLASYLSREDLGQLQRIYAEEYNMATTIVRSFSPANISSYVQEWISARATQPIVNLLIGSALTTATEALKVFSVLETHKKEFNKRVSFLHLIYVLHKPVFEQDKQLAQQLDSEIDKLRDPNVWPDSVPKLEFALLLMNRYSDTQLHEYVSNLDKKYTDPGPYQCRFFAKLSLGKGWIDLAFNMFGKLRAKILQKPKKEVVNLVAGLIKHDTVVNGPSGPNFRFLSELLQKGLTLDSVLHSCVIERALEIGYPGVAWDLFHHLQQGDHEIDARTYLLLLRDSFAKKNEQGVNEIMSEMHREKALYTNPYLLSCAMNIIRNVCFSYQKMETSECLVHMLALYDRAYTRAPLIRLGIVSELGPNELAVNLPEPDTYMLCFTIWAHILCHRHIPTALKIWEKIHERIQKGDTAVVKCMTMDFLYNAYILLYRRSAMTLPHALEMFQYMLEKRWCLPSERTWGILIYGFLRHGQRSEARRLIDLMVAHGFTTKDLDPQHLPQGLLMEDVEAIATADLEEFLMPDGSDPLRSRLLDIENSGSATSSLPIGRLKQEVGRADKSEGVEEDFALSGSFARLVTV